MSTWECSYRRYGMKPLWQSGLLKCERCGTTNGTERVYEPFLQEVWGRNELTDYCEECAKASYMET